MYESAYMAPKKSSSELIMEMLNSLRPDQVKAFETETDTKST